MADELKFQRLLKVNVVKSEKSKVILQVAKWGDNNPSLEKRSYYLKDGEWHTGKAAGINYQDFKKILKMKNEIKSVLKSESSND